MSHRLQQISALIQKDAANIIRRELELPKGVIVGITKVVVGPDLKFAKILVSIMPETEAEPVLKFLNKNRLTVQQALVGQLTMKFSPKISFGLDAIEANAQRIEEMLNELQDTRNKVQTRHNNQ